MYIVKIEKNKKSSILIKNKREDFFYRNVVYAAIIASKARIKLNKSLNLVLKNKGKLYYTDTDSIFAGFRSDKTNEEMGDIKWAKISNDMVFISNKVYFKDNDEGFTKIKDQFYNGESFKSDFLDKEGGLFTLIKENKLNFQNYEGRVFSRDKKTTSPRVLNPDL